jgi:membrane associated rhomboid family serine protease
MDLVLLPQHWSAVLCICIMIGSLFYAYVKKTMMVYALIVSNIIIFVVTLIYYSEIVSPYSLTPVLENLETYPDIFPGLGFRPFYLSLENSPQLYTLFTSMFIHGDFLHIFGNMLVFFFIGTALEERIGGKKFIIIYLLSGVVGALTHSILYIESDTPLVGASGAIFGIMGALVFAYPRDEVVMPVPLGIIMVLRRIKVVYAVILFAVFETVLVFIGSMDQTAHLAHLGGLIGGFVLAAIFLRGRKTHTKEGKTVYYDTFSPEKLEKIDFTKLESLAVTIEQKDILEKIKSESIPHAREIWLEHFFDKTICPKCGSKLNHFNHRVSCENCGFKTRY